MGSAIEASFVGLVLVVLFIALCRGWYTAEVVVFLSLLVVWNVGIVSTTEALSGFNNPGVLAIGALFVVVSSVESSGLAGKAAQRVLGLTTSFSSGFLRLLLCAAAMSAFCNNTPILALLIPITKDWARTRGFRAEVLLMPVAYACAFGGLMTTVGGGTNLVIQGLLYEAGKEDEDVGPFRLFEPGHVGLPLALVGVAYLLVAAPSVLAGSKAAGVGEGLLPTTLRDRSGDVLTEVEVTQDSELVDQPFALVLASLGLPLETLVKVRRQRLLGDDADADSRAPSSTDVSGSVYTSGGSRDDGDAGSGRTGNGVCPLAAGDEEPNGSSWTGRVIGSVRGGATSSRPRGGGGGGRGSRSPFAALRRRKSYQLLENEDDEERPGKSNSSAGAGIEMAPLRAADAMWEEEGSPTAKIAGGATTGDGIRHRGSFDEMHDVCPDAIVRGGDVLVLSCDRNAMVCAQGSLLSGRKGGLRVLGVSTLRLPRPGSAFFELVLSRTSHFLGRTARLDNGALAARYGCSVVAFRLKGSTGGGVDLIGRSSTGSDRGEDGGGNEEEEGAVSPGGRGSKESTRESLTGVPEPSMARGDPTFLEAVASPGAVTAIADDEVGEAFFMGGDGSPMVDDGSRSPLAPTAPTPLVSSPEGPSPTMSARRRISGERKHASWRQDRAGGANVGAKRRRRRRRGEAFQPGDVVVVLATERFSEWCESSAPGEFLRKKLIGRLPEPTGWFHFFPLTIFALMLAWVLLGGVDMIRAVFTAAAVLLLAGWVDANQAVGHVNWGLLLLIGSALGFSKAIANSGLAAFAGRAVRESGMSPSASLYALFGLTMFCTELISNNAAAALNIPIALSIAQELKADYKPFAMTVLVAASCSFLTPIGTPTNTLVWKPGGYKFQDYAKLGAPLSLLFWVAACAAIPWVFPF